ncbi:MAG: hypothetical protein OEO77_15825 [Acidimicrobiia bacterium]|nr:hypothetical protein [Acidimicrobiia bacterium]
MSPLEQELLAVEGVRNAHVRITERGPAGVRVVLADDADRVKVAADIHRLLEGRGLSTLIDPGPVAPRPGAGPAGLPEVPPPPSPFPARSPHPDAGAAFVAEADTPAAPAKAPESLVVGIEDAGGESWVTVQHGPLEARRLAGVSAEAIRVAALSALWEVLENQRPLPEIVSVVVAPAGHRSMLTVVLNDGGSVGVGSALIGATRLRAFVDACRLASASL